MKNECLQRLVCDHFDIFKTECDKLIPKEDYDGIKAKNNKLIEIDSSFCFHYFSVTQYVQIIKSNTSWYRLYG